MITTIKTHSVQTLANGQHRAHLHSAFWLGDYSSHAIAAKAIRLAEHLINIGKPEKWFYDGGVGATEKTHEIAVQSYYKDDAFGPHNPLEEDLVRRSILPGDEIKTVGGWPVSLA